VLRVPTVHAQQADPATAAQATQQQALPQQDPAQQDSQQAPPQQAPPAQQANPQGQVQDAPQTAPKPPVPSPVAPPSDTPTPQEPKNGPIVTAAPELPKYPDVRLPGETGFWLGISLSVPKESPIFDRGHAATFPQASHVVMQGSPKYAADVELGIALGLHNALKLSYWGIRAAGDFTAPQDLTLWSQTYTKGTLVSTNYRIQDFKMSFEYLTWPYPVESRKYRLKTLWQLHYISARSSFDAPLLPLVDSTGAPLVDSSGNPVNYATQGTKWWITPTFGLGWTQYVTRNVRIDLNAAGFLLPHKWTVYDTDASVNFRVMGHFELQGGAKAFHYKSSPAGEFFIRNTMVSVFFGVRWYSE
jgi:hypothetical protein